MSGSFGVKLKFNRRRGQRERPKMPLRMNNGVSQN